MFGILEDIYRNAFPNIDLHVFWVKNIPQIVILVANIVIVIAFGASIVYLALSLINLITAPSSGDPKKTEQALHGVLYAAGGMLLSLLAYAIKNVLLNVFGITQPAS